MFRDIILCVIITIAFFFPAGISGNSHGSDMIADQDLERILLKVEDANSQLKAMEADIKYSRVIALLDSEEISYGYLQYRKPGLVNLNFFPPRNEVNVIDGKYIWVYHIDEKQVEKYEISGDTDSPQGMDIFELGYEYTVERVKADYDVTLLDDISAGDGATLFHLELTPRDTFDSDYDRILLWIKDDLWLPVQYQLFESDGEIINTIELSHIELNTEMPDTTFILNLPDDVEIIEPFK